jgi:transcription antitermination factor NusG
MKNITFALTTRVGHERKVARELTVASERVLGYRVDVEIVFDEGKPRWPGMILVAMTDTEESDQFIRRFPGVIGQPAGPLGAKDIDALTRELPLVAQSSPADIREGNILYVTEGPFAGLPTTVELVDDVRVRGAVVVFGRDTSVWFDRSQLRSR